MDELLELGRSYQPACILAAAVDLDLFTALGARGLTAGEAARSRKCDERGMTILLDALASLELLRKKGDRYAVPESVLPLLAGEGASSILAMTRHQANCVRRWAQLPQIVQTGRPAERIASIRGDAADSQAFIGAMHDISGPVADEVIQGLAPLGFRHLLDIGGASGTWTAALLNACPGAIGTLFDLPEVIPLARKQLSALGVADRVELAAGDYLADPLPHGADLAWVSAIVHQHSREENLALFASAFAALVPGGRIAVRDLLMEESRTAPVFGALFAVNMLVNTMGGGTYTYEEIREDLETAGFVDVACPRREEGMSSLVTGRKRGGS